MLSLLISLLGVLITILLVVGVHELGHFIVAKSLGIKVLRFSIGFGKSLLRWTDKSGTEYTLAAIPLGGYVKMLDENEGPVVQAEKSRTFNQQPFYKKMAVIAAGPLFNLVFAFVIYWILFTVGFISVAPVIGTVAPHSIAEQSGLQTRQEILSIGDQKTNSWTTVVITLLLHTGDNKNLVMTLQKPDASTFTSPIDLTHWHLNHLRPDPLASLGITPYEPFVPAIIGDALPDGPAITSGLMKGDKILSINGKPVKDWYDVVDQTQSHPNEIIPFTITRADKQISVPVSVGSKSHLFGDNIGFLGVSPAFKYPADLLRHNKYNPLEALGHAWQDVTLFTEMNFVILAKMCMGKISLQSLGGPITIFQSAGTALNNGVLSFLSFLAFLSISIGIINVIPIPGLDGGHLLFQFIEMIMRRPLSEKYMMLFYRLGMLFLLLIMVTAFVNDVLRL